MFNWHLTTGHGDDSFGMLGRERWDAASGELVHGHFQQQLLNSHHSTRGVGVLGLSWYSGRIRAISQHSLECIWGLGGCFSFQRVLTAYAIIRQWR